MNRTVTFTIDNEGNAVFLKSHGGDAFLALGDVSTQRASHVEPDSWLLRLLFHAIRGRTEDASRLAAFTRSWRCLWRVNTAPVGGPILEGRWSDRLKAIDAEVEFLNQHFLTGEFNESAN